MKTEGASVAQYMRKLFRDNDSIGNVQLDERGSSHSLCRYEGPSVIHSGNAAS